MRYRGACQDFSCFLLAIVFITTRANADDELETAPCTIDVRDASSLTLEQFVDEYQNKRPVLLRSAAKSWAAQTKWSKDYMLQQFGTAKVTPELGPVAPTDVNNKGEGMTLAAYLKHGTGFTRRQRTLQERKPQNSTSADKGRGSDVPYLFTQITRVVSAEEAQQSLGNLTYWQHWFEAAPGCPWTGCGMDTNKFKAWMQANPGHLEYRYSGFQMFIMLGGSGSGLGFHRHGQAWNIAITGTRRWLIIDAPNEGLPTNGISTQEWLRTKYPKMPPSAKPFFFECVQRKGDALYVPNQWAHAVLNYGDALAVSINREGDDESVKGPDDRADLPVGGLEQGARHVGSVTQQSEPVLGSASKQRDLESKGYKDHVIADEGEIITEEERLARIEKLMDDI